MKVLIVAKTRRGAGACVGGITEAGQSVRLIAGDAACNERAGLEYEVGEVWDIESTPDPGIRPPHVENIIVLAGRRLRRSDHLVEAIHRFMTPVAGGPDKLFDGLTQPTTAGGLYVAESTGLPARSTMFWTPDRPLRLDYDGKRLRYRYPTPDGGRTLTYVGFQEPLEEVPAGTLLRVSLAHRWRPAERPEEELRCFVQLSGWFIEQASAASPLPVQNRPRAGAAEKDFRGADPEPRHLPPRPPRSPDAAPRHTGSDPAQPGVTQPSGSGVSAAVRGSASRALDILEKTFGFSSFLPLQDEVVQRVLERRDTLVVMPTGAGKSLCYQLPAVLFDGLTVVVSPLVSLMQDQVTQLRLVGVPAACLNHTVPVHEYTAIMNRARHGDTRLLYVAPETLLRPETLLLMEHSRLACLAIDEAHCISEWGHDFRPEYRQLQAVRHRFPRAVCLALTASATPRVREDIRRLLDIPRAGEFVASFNRPNLFLAVKPRRDGLAQVLAFLRARQGQSGIIYCGTRKQTDELCDALNLNGCPALPYHAGLPEGVRRQNQERFLRGRSPLMVATIAFGMGINKPDLRFVVHAHLPGSMENYYQEIGRAGRDGLPAHCLLLYSRGDVVIQRHFIDQGAPSERAGRNARLQALVRFAEARNCRRQTLLAYFGERLEPGSCAACDNCVQPVAPGRATDATDAAQMFLACVRATGQMFGSAHIIAVLRGSRSERVLSRQHDRLRSFGLGREHSAEQWRELAQELIRLGLVEQEVQFGGLRLTPQGWEALNGKQKVLVHLPLEPGPATTLPAAAQDPGSASVIRPINRRRFRQVGELFAAGQSIEQIARHYDILPSTVVAHLCRFLDSGGAIDPQRVLASSRLSEPERARVFSAFERLGCQRLTPVWEALSGEIDYEELHLLRLYCLLGEQLG